MKKTKKQFEAQTKRVNDLRDAKEHINCASSVLFLPYDLSERIKELATEPEAEFWEDLIGTAAGMARDDMYETLLDAEKSLAKAKEILIKDAELY